MVIELIPDTTTLLEIEFGFFEQFQTMKDKQYIPWLEVETKFIAFSSRNCTLGEYYTELYTCSKCPEGKNTYSNMTIANYAEPCEECLENAVCDEAKTYPAAGFVRMNKKHFIFVKCFNENACDEGNEVEKLTNCAEGYDGIMCTSCSDFYWKPQGTFQCYGCYNQSSEVSWYVFKVIVFSFFCYWISRLLFRSFAKQNQESLAAVRIFLTMS